MIINITDIAIYLWIILLEILCVLSLAQYGSFWHNTKSNYDYVRLLNFDTVSYEKSVTCVDGSQSVPVLIQG